MLGSVSRDFLAEFDGIHKLAIAAIVRISKTFRGSSIFYDSLICLGAAQMGNR